jgi:predicted GNAT family N-acyltransferase
VTGALLVPWFTVPRQAFELLRGAPVRRESSPGIWRGHCAACGTSLTYESGPDPQQATGTVPEADIDITTASLDDVDAIAPDAHIWTGDDHGWMRNLHRLPRFSAWRSEGRLEPGFPLPPGIVMRLVEWPAARAELMAVRTKVFVEEQGVPADLEEDDRDPHCLHLLVTRGGEPVGAARLDVARRGKVGRVAVLPGERNRGIGIALMRVLHALGTAHGLTEVWCHAQQSAVPFYEGQGYHAEGAQFAEAGIPHRLMRRSLAR